MSYIIFIYSVVVLINVIFCQSDGPIQPKWTVDHGKHHRPKKVEANLQNLMETASIRSEIDSAIRHHKYVVGGEDEEELVHDADRELGEDFRKRYGLLGSTLKAVHSNVEATEGDQDALYKLLNIIPNQVASDLVEDSQVDEIFIPEYKASDYEDNSDTREVLQINKVEADLSFWLGEGVHEWKSYGNGDLVGVFNTNLALIRRKNGNYQKIKDIELVDPIRSVETFTYLNRTGQTVSNLAVVALNSSVVWVRTEDMEIFLKWPIEAKSLKYFESDDSHFLAALTASEILIYQFNLATYEYWLTQTIPVEKPSNEMHFLDIGYQKLLIVLQQNQILLFKSEGSDNGYPFFVKTLPISTANDTIIDTFQMGGYSYLAVGGIEPTIYRYHYGAFRPQTILDPNFGFVEKFLAVPCRTYRDDMILLVQHRIDFETHSIRVVESLVWNGVAFEASKSVPCKIGESTEIFGVSCLLDIDRDEGLKGAAAVNYEGKVAVLVPRFEAPSGLFRIETEFVPKRTEVEDLEFMLWKMEAIIADQDKAMEILENKLWSLDKVNTQQFTFRGNIEKLFLNNEQWTDEDNEVDIDQLLIDLKNMHKELEKRERDMIVEDIIVKDLFLENLNGQPFEELREVHHEGTIVVEGDLIADEYHQPSLLKAEEGENIGMLDLVQIDGNLTVSKINGIAWDDFIQNVVFKDKPENIDFLKVDKIIIYEDLNLGALNNFSFPGDFLLSSGPKTSRITGKKTFVNMLNANAMDCDGTINNIKPSDFITLGQEQTISGTTTFNQLEVSNSFEINGTISGKNLESYLTNPTLLDTNKIYAECQFRELVVDGPVIIKGLYNKGNFDNILDDVVYKNEEKVVFNSTKIFGEIEFDSAVRLSSNKINDVDLDEFVTISTNQTLDITEIEGDVYFKNLQLDGLFNSANVTAMNLNSIPLDGNEFVNTILVFKESEFLQSDSLVVERSLNGISINDFTDINDPIHLKNVTIDELSVDQLNVFCDIEGDATLNGINLTKFNEERFSLSQNQTIKNNIFVEKTIIDADLAVKSINKFPIEYLLQGLGEPEDIPSALRSTKHVHVIGNVSVKSINGMNSGELWSNVIWLDRPNKISKEMRFLDKVIFQDDVFLGSKEINGVNFEKFLDDLVLNTNDHVYVKGPKKFLKPIKIIGDTTIDMINDIPAAELATKDRPMTIEGDLTVKGDLEINTLEMEGEKFGELDIQEIFETYQYDSTKDMHYIRGAVQFKGNTSVEKLNVEGSINGREGPNELFQNIVYRNDTREITGKKIFGTAVQFEDGLFMGRLNGLNMVEYLDNVVYMNEEEPVEVDYRIIFKSPVTAEYVQVVGDVHTYNLMGCELREWLDNCLRIDRPANIEGSLVFSEGALDGMNLKASNLNGLPMSKMITLNTPQEFNESISFQRVYLDEPVVVDGMVNGIDLVKEYENTFKISGNQHIRTPIEVTSIQILRNMETSAPINGYNLREVATLHDNLVFRSSLTFKHISADQLNTNDHISGLNFTDWYHTSLKTNSSENQTITGEWSINDLYIDSKNVTIKSSIKAGNIKDLKSLGTTFRDAYKATCEETMKLKQLSSERVSFVKYLKKDLELIRQKTIDSIYSIEFVDSTLILVNEGCISKVYKWDAAQDRFKRIGKMETGSVVEIHTKDNHTFTTFATAPERGCQFLGSMDWKIEGQDVILKQLSKSRSANQKSVFRYKKKTRCTRSVKESYPDFNTPIEKITSKMVDDLQSSKESDFDFVASSFSDSVKDVAKKLWIGLTQLDDVKTIIHHARKIYHAINTDTNEHDHGNHTEVEETPTSDSADKIVGAEGPKTFSTPAQSSSSYPTSSSLIAVQRLETILDVIPLGFGDLVASARSPVNDHDFESQLRRLITGITKAFHPVQTPSQTTQLKRSLEHIANVSRSLETLRQFAEGSSDLEDIFTNFESVPEDPAMAPAELTQEYREALSFHVGTRGNRQELIAVISPVGYQSVRLYNKDLEMFQTIETHHPFKLTSMEIQEETILAFIDYYNIIRVMKYKGLEGFVEWSSFRAETQYPVTQLISFSLAKRSSVCRSYYLVTAWMEHIQFYEIVLGGMCPVKTTVDNCNGWW